MDGRRGDPIRRQVDGEGWTHIIISPGAWNGRSRGGIKACMGYPEWHGIALFMGHSLREGAMLVPHVLSLAKLLESPICLHLN